MEDADGKLQGLLSRQVIFEILESLLSNADPELPRDL